MRGLAVAEDPGLGNRGRKVGEVDLTHVTSSTGSMFPEHLSINGYEAVQCMLRADEHYTY
jgi:hypothetical protein